MELGTEQVSHGKQLDALMGLNRLAYLPTKLAKTFWSYFMSQAALKTATSGRLKSIVAR